MNHFTQGTKVRFLSTPTTKQMGIVGKYGEVLIGRSRTGHVKILTPTRAGLMSWWFPQSALKLCGTSDPRPPVDSIVMFLPTPINEKHHLTDVVGIVIQNLPQSAYSHIETACNPDVCSHFSEIERIDI